MILNKSIGLLLYLLFVCSFSFGQLLSYFTFDSDPPTEAAFGPNAFSISSSALSDVGGVTGTNGLNAGLPAANIQMKLTGSPLFDVDGIDISFDYQREEGIGDFFFRGASLTISGCANLSVSYRVDDGGGGFTTISSGDVYAIPNDDVFRNYRFTYDPCDGIGELTVDCISVWSFDGPDNRNMYWVGAPNITIGGGMNGSGNNVTFLDNFLIYGINCANPTINCLILPIELTYFSARKAPDRRIVELEWETASETDSDHYIIERSTNGTDFNSIGQLPARGTSNVANVYYFEDENPLNGLSYYRLKQVDLNGQNTFSDIRSVYINGSDIFSIFPNPVFSESKLTVNLPNSEPGYEQWALYSNDGKLIRTGEFSAEKNNQFIELNGLASGTYYITISGINGVLREQFIVQ